MEALHQTDLERLRPVVARYDLEATAVSLLSTPYSDDTSYRVATDSGDIHVKEIPKQQVGLLSLEHRLQQLHAYHYAAMPRYYSTHAERFVTVSGLKKYMVADWVDGVPISLVQTDENLKQLGRNLAQLHQIPYPTQSRLRNASEIRTLMGEDGRRLLSDVRVQQVFTNAVKHPVLTHSAVRPENVMVVGNKLASGNAVVLLNWDRVEPGCAYAEVAKTLLNVGGGNTDAMQSLLTGYEEIRPLLHEERQLIFGFFSFPNDSRHIMREVERTAVLNGSTYEHPDTARLQQATEWLRSWSGW